jgi:hypothetical protein
MLMMVDADADNGCKPSSSINFLKSHSAEHQAFDTRCLAKVDWPRYLN